MPALSPAVSSALSSGSTTTPNPFQSAIGYIEIPSSVESCGGDVYTGEGVDASGGDRPDPVRYGAIADSGRAYDDEPPVAVIGDPEIADGVEVQGNRETQSWQRTVRADAVDRQNRSCSAGWDLHNAGVPIVRDKQIARTVDRDARRIV